MTISRICCSTNCSSSLSAAPIVSSSTLYATSTACYIAAYVVFLITLAMMRLYILCGSTIEVRISCKKERTARLRKAVIQRARAESSRIDYLEELFCLRIITVVVVDVGQLDCKGLRETSAKLMTTLDFYFICFSTLARFINCFSSLAFLAS